MLCSIGIFEPGTAGLLAQMDPLYHGLPLIMCFFTLQMLFYLLLNLLLLSFSVTRCNKTKSKFSLKWPKSKHNSFSFKIDILKNITISRHIFGLLLYETLPPRTFKSRPNWSHCCRSTHFSCFC